MGVLIELSTARRITLSSRCLLGRHRSCDVRVHHAHVSGEHVAVHWMGDRWELRDLGSRNGTQLEGRALAPGARVPLPEGATLTLGSAEGGGPSFLLADASAPIARARAADGRVREAVGGQLVLPSEEDPVASIFENAAGVWTLELPDTEREVADEAVVTVEGMTWTLELPEPHRATWHAGAAVSLESIALRLGVSRDEEYVEVTVLHGSRETKLPSRSAHYLLVVLARARLAEQGPEGERGWVDRRTLCSMLASDPNRLGVDIHRLRKQFGELGILGAADIVVRRPTTGHLRLGTGKVEVFGLG